MIKEIDSLDLQQRLASGSDILLLDIRSEGEVVHGILPGAQHIPMHLLPVRMHEFPRDTPLVLYCRSGARSYHACSYLMQQGFENVINLRGGIIAWAREGHQITPRVAV